MSFWTWPYFEAPFINMPHNKWFLNTTIPDILDVLPGDKVIWIPLMLLRILVIPPTDEKEHYQIVVNGWHYSMASSPEYTVGDVSGGKIYHLYTYPGEAPRWGNPGKTMFQNSCANMGYVRYIETGEPVAERMQSASITAAIQTTQLQLPHIVAAVSKSGSLSSRICATIEGETSLTPLIGATIEGDAVRWLPIRAAVRAERSESPGISVIVAHDFEENPGISATLQGNPYREIEVRAAIKGEAHTHPRIITNIVKDRTDAIMLEMELLLPQDLDLRSTPQAPSRFKDYRRDTLGR